MKKLLTGFLISFGLIAILAVSFVFYAQFALDYSFENLREALEVSSQETVASPAANVGTRALGVGLESLVLEEISTKDADFETVTLMEHASRSLRAAIEQSGYTQAGVYLAEILKERKGERNPLLQVTDSVYYFLKGFIQTLQGFWKYALKRIQKSEEEEPLVQAGVLILAEAEKAEKSWKLKEAEQYYREFLNRYPGRPERGFVKISLAYTLIKQQQLKEAKEILRHLQKEFPGGRESTIAANLVERIGAIQKRMNRIPELENWIKSSPERFLTQEGGLELALSYLATYQIEQALSVLKQLEGATDPRVRTKALFYQGWIYKWQGDLEQGKALFQMLQAEPVIDKQIEVAAMVHLAEVHYERKEFKEALQVYEDLSAKVSGEVWRALAQLERAHVYLFGLKDAEAALGQLEKLRELFPKGSPEFAQIQKRFQSVLARSRRDEAFRILAEGKVDVALKMLEDYFKEYPKDGTALGGIASILLIQGQLEEALERAQKAFQLERTEYTSSVLGFVYEKMQKFDEAIQYYEIALRVKPYYLPAKFNLAWIWVQTQKYQEADELLTELENVRIDYSPTTQAKILNNRGCALWGLGRQEEALARFQAALKIVPDFNEARKNLTLTAGEKPAPAVI